MRILRQPSRDVELALSAVWCGGSLLQSYFEKPINEQGIVSKRDKSKITKCGKIISNSIVRFIGDATGELTMTEEEAYANVYARKYITDYENPNAWCLDPDDGTHDYLRALELGVACSLVGVSLAKIVDGRPQVGALNFPLLDGRSRIYLAQEGEGAYSREDDLTQLIDTGDRSQQEGVVLVSENEHRHIDRIVDTKGLTVVRMGGIAFKMMAAIDSRLIYAYFPRLNPEQQSIFTDQPILGVVSTSAALHDVAAAAVVAREQGVLVSGVTGDEDLPRGKGAHGIIVARNEHIQSILVDAVASEYGPM